MNVLIYIISYLIVCCPLIISLKSQPQQWNPLTLEVGGHSKYIFGVNEW